MSHSTLKQVYSYLRSLVSREFYKRSLHTKLIQNRYIHNFSKVLWHTLKTHLTGAMTLQPATHIVDCGCHTEQLQAGKNCPRHIISKRGAMTSCLADQSSSLYFLVGYDLEVGAKKHNVCVSSRENAGTKTEHRRYKWIINRTELRQLSGVWEQEQHRP
jgi:hypothetical protein